VSYSLGHDRCVLPQALYAVMERLWAWIQASSPAEDEEAAGQAVEGSTRSKQPRVLLTRRAEAGARPTTMAELCLLYAPVSRSRRSPQEMAGGARLAAMAEHSPCSRSRRGDASDASPCLAERRHEKAAGARPAAMSERSRSSRSRRRLPCVPAFG
jgi:hypothetical protein